MGPTRQQESKNGSGSVTRESAARFDRSTTPSAFASALGNVALQHVLQARRVQAKLSISDPSDSFEQEAERVADTVLRMPDATSSVAAMMTPSIQRLCDRCEQDSTAVLPRQPLEPVDHAVAGEVALENSLDALQGRGSALPDAVRTFMEPRFKADFSAVRVHHDANAHALARAVGAQAFTQGQDIVFAAGHYAPHSAHGRRLLAHELTHVVQQRPSYRDASPSLLQREVATAAPAETREARLRRQANTTVEVLTTSVVRADARGDAGVTITLRHTGDELVPGFAAHAEPHYERPSGMTHATEGTIAGELQPCLDMVLLSGAGEWRLEFGRTEGGQMRLRTMQSLGTAPQRRSAGPIELEPVEIRGVACTCDPATQQQYAEETFQFITSIEPLVRSIAQGRGVPMLPVAGAIADEYNTRRGIRTVVDALQDAVLDALPEFSIDVDRFLDIHSKLLNALENDVGPANINVRTALELVQSGELSVAGSPATDAQVSRIIDSLLTERGTVEAAAAVIARAHRLFGPYLAEHGEELVDAVLVEYFKQGDGYYRRFISAVVANPSHRVCPGDGGCRVWYNRDRLLQALSGS